ncbi:MAG: CBS domain-containing protein [Candidatus Thermoplasmatota archaeon]|nr:CBS domain-containing protein [Candidatus Thermoplasmatota archaeon]
MKDTVRWIIMSDRRLVTLRCFTHSQYLGASEIARDTGRSIQNVGTALKELEGRKVVSALEPGRKTWKKFGLTSVGKSVLDLVERELSVGMFERMADELSFRFVRDAYRLVVTNPIVVTKGMGLHDVVDRVLADPRTRSAYVVDDERKLIGMIGLTEMLAAIQGSLSLFEKGRQQPRSKRISLPFSVEEYMVKPVTVTEDDRVLTALERMMKHGLEDLPVIDEHNTLIGELNGFEILLLGSEVMRRQRRG